MTTEPEPVDPFRTFDAANVAFISSQEATEQLAKAFDSWVVAILASRPLMADQQGPTDGVIKAEGGVAYAFSGEVKIPGDGVVKAHYEVKDHPTVRSVIVGSSSRGHNVRVTVEGTDRQRQSKSFLFDF